MTPDDPRHGSHNGYVNGGCRCPSCCEASRLYKQRWRARNRAKIVGYNYQYRLDIVARFWAKVDRSGGAVACWPWTASCDGKGYGRFAVTSKAKAAAHRFAYELLVGPIPDGLVLDHLCRTRCCCNPGHLEPVTSRENTLRGDTIPARRAARTHCDNGHEFTPENTRIERHNGRKCRICDSFRNVRRRGTRGRSPRLAPACPLCGRPNDLAGPLRPHCSLDCAHAHRLLTESEAA